MFALIKWLLRDFLSLHQCWLGTAGKVGESSRCSVGGKMRDGPQYAPTRRGRNWHLEEETTIGREGEIGVVANMVLVHPQQWDKVELGGRN